MKRIETPSKQPAAGWWYVSFSGVSAFLGAAFVQARTKPAAIRRTHFLGIYPAGVEDVLCLPITEAEIKKHVPTGMRDRLLTERETRKLGGKRVGE